VTLPDPYRGYAGPTWDTRTLASLIASLGGVGAAPPPALAVADARYAPSAQQYYLECNNGDGTNTLQTISNAVFTSLNIAGTVTANPGGGFNATTDIYTLPVNGIYACQALVRIKDGFGTNCNLGIGWHTSNIDGYWFQWNKFFTGAGGRCSFDYTRITSFSAGQQLRLYCFQDSGVNMDLTAVNLSCWRIG